MAKQEGKKFDKNVRWTAEEEDYMEQDVEITEETMELHKNMKKELLKQKIKHYGKYVAIGAGIGGLAYLAKKALESNDEVEEIIEGVFEEIGE